MSKWEKIEFKIFVFTVCLCLFLLIGALATGHAQSCNSVISDGENVLGSGTQSVLDSATALMDQGADVHIITTSAQSSTLEAKISNLAKSCDNWKSPNGSVKANMIVIAVAPRERKMAIFYGPGYHAAFDSQVDRIKRDYMGPRFKGGDFSGGIAAAERQLAARLKSSMDESNKPVTNQTVNQAEDLHGLWVFLGFLGFMVVCAGIIFLIIRIKKYKDRTSKVQRDACDSRDRVVNLLSDLSPTIDKYPDINTAPYSVKRAIPIIDTASKQYALLAGSVSGDPTTEGMSQSFYESLDTAYSRIEQKLSLAKEYIVRNEPEPVAPPPAKKKKAARSYAAASTANQDRHAAPVKDSQASSGTTPVPGSTVVVNNPSSGSDLLTGVLIGEELNRPYRDPEPEPERHHREPDPEPEPSKSSSDWGGSSSSYDSGSDSSSSSSDFGGGSSDFGSSDSGGGFGGGSSDF